MLKVTKPISCAAALLSAIILTPATHAQNGLSENVLVNGGFEDDVMNGYGNHTAVINNGQPTGWTFGTGQNPNLIKVDGPGGQATWYTSGPDSDATNSGSGVDRQYLDIHGGSNQFYQSFRPVCDGEVQFGGAFSNRDGARGRGSISIRQGNGLNGQIIGQTNVVNIPSGNPVGRPWTNANFTTNLSANQTYSFVVDMNDTTNFDEAYVRFITGCNAPEPGVLGSRPLGVDQLATFDPFPPTPDGEHYQCYILQKSEKLKEEYIQIEDQFGKSSVVLGQPAMICNPSSKIHKDKQYDIQNKERHLVCYNYVKQNPVESHELRIQTQFGKDEVLSGRQTMFCAPAGKNHIK